MIDWIGMPYYFGLLIQIFYKMSFEKYKHLCEKGSSHSGREVIMICMNAECDGRRLCCLACIDEIHRKHELISLYKFDSMLQILTHRLQPDTQTAILSSIREFQASLTKSLDRVVEKFSSQVEKCKMQIRSIIEHMQESVNLNFTPQDVDALYRELNNAKVCEYLELIKEAENQNFKSVESTAKALKLAELGTEKHIVQCEKHYLKGIQELNKGIAKLKLMIKSTGIKKRAFSKIHKAVSIEVNSELDEAKRFQGAGGYPIVVIEEPISELYNSVNVLVKEQPGNKGVWMGVCVLDIVKTFHYASCYGMGKGAWAIDQVGASHQSAYSWSHHDSNYNSQPKVGWQFHTGDTVNISVNLSKSLVIFTKGSLVYEMPIKTDIGDLYFFVGPTHINDTLALV